ncbi:MAG: hypothetical protein LQ350_001139 [Teloschistes chrysophthalmus]|nr:MAG: hypothetical protein LQ350_001139 [Niorma chrysophthalma]
MAVRDIYRQRVRVTKDVSEDEESTTSDFPAVPSAIELEESETTSAEESVSENSTGRDSFAPELDVAVISFGALAEAQESLATRTGRLSKYSTGLDRPVNSKHVYSAEAREGKTGKRDSKEHFRSSKHAPAEMSSKKAVSRRREAVPTLRRDIRDPRFEPTSGPLDEARARKNYSFLDGYRDSEIAQLKAGIRQTKDATAVEKLKRVLISMESKKETQERKDQQQEVQRAHRAKEKELIKQGKRPFYLKRGELKKLALVQRFEGLKEKQVEKVIERRRKKKTQKERRGMPEGRRALNG